MIYGNFTAQFFGFFVWRHQVPVVTATIPVDPNCRYEEGTFPHFSGLVDSIT
jgi:hypothetical protein